MRSVPPCFCAAAGSKAGSSIERVIAAISAQARQHRFLRLFYEAPARWPMPCCRDPSTDPLDANPPRGPPSPGPDQTPVCLANPVGFERRISSARDRNEQNEAAWGDTQNGCGAAHGSGILPLRPSPRRVSALPHKSSVRLRPGHVCGVIKNDNKSKTGHAASVRRDTGGDACFSARRKLKEAHRRRAAGPPRRPAPLRCR